ncbi:MAG: YoaK family protein [Gammaproteobacteria bacterium]|nr:YoaK family protein [Gammaproteobacteria bacterium]
MKSNKYYNAIFIGAMLLTVNAGYINAVVLLGIYHHAVSYMTGNLANIGLAIQTHHPFGVVAPLLIVLSFVSGAMISGIIITTSQFSINQHYAKALLVLALILAASTLLMKVQDSIVLGLSECLAAMACGLQNAMTTTFSGAIIRTTHMTGVLTDLGIQLGRLLKGEHAETWKITFFSSLALSFILGSVLGLIVFSYVNTQAMWISSIACLVFSLSFNLWNNHPSPEQ